MKRLRHLASVVWLALALVAGQQAVALHALGHAAEQLGQKREAPAAPAKCDSHFLCTQLSGAVGTAEFAAPLVAAMPPLAVAAAAAAPVLAPRFAFHSRAPPPVS